MADLSTNIRLAVDSGKVAMGARGVVSTIKKNTSKMIITAANGRGDTVSDIAHLSKIANIKLVKFEGNSIELGAVCGKPYSVSALSIIDPGNSKILEEA
jgi:large subunit ribosomal protein L30e